MKKQEITIRIQRGFQAEVTETLPADVNGFLAYLDVKFPSGAKGNWQVYHILTGWKVADISMVRGTDSGRLKAFWKEFGAKSYWGFTDPEHAKVIYPQFHADLLAWNIKRGTQPSVVGVPA